MVEGQPPPGLSDLVLPPQTEIAKRLNAILAQIMPFLSQEVSSEASG